MSRIADEFLALHPDLLEPTPASQEWQSWVARLAAPLALYFRFRAEGLERIPERPCVIVANHSVGSPFVIPLLHRAWFRHAPQRLVRGLFHRLIWQRPFCWFPVFQKLGGILAHPRVAEGALRRGESVLVFPGGEFDAMRPFSQRYSANLRGRHGFVSLARAAGVPIVPLAICGSHSVYTILPGGERLGRWLSLPRLLGLKVFPFTLGMAIAAAASVAALIWPRLAPLALAAWLLGPIPMPTRIVARVLDPIDVLPGTSDAEMALLVEARLTQALQGLAHGRATPWG